MAEAWFCPSCQRHHAPHVETCPTPADAVSTKRMPYIPATPVSPYIVAPIPPTHVFPWPNGWPPPEPNTAGFDPNGPHIWVHNGGQPYSIGSALS